MERIYPVGNLERSGKDECMYILDSQDGTPTECAFIHLG